MANSFADVKALAEKDRAFWGGLIVDPKKALKDHNIELTSPNDIRKVEQFVKESQDHIKTVGQSVGLEMSAASWGIGASCCNSPVLEAWKESGKA